MSSVFDDMKTLCLREYRNHPVATVLLTAMFLFLLIFVAASFATEGRAVYNILWYSRNPFPDYFDSIFYSSNNPYTDWNVIYPPIVTFIYDLLGHLTVPFLDEPFTDPNVLRNSQMGIVSYLMLTISGFYLLHLVVSKTIGDEDVRTDALLFLVFLTSYPFIYVIERGNNILFVVVFCFMFLLGYRSENRVIRYASYVALGFAAGFKLSPAIFGLLIVRERRWKEALVCMGIGIAIVLLPFLFVDMSISAFFKNVFDYSESGVPYGFINLSQFVRVAGARLGVPESTVGLAVVLVLSVFITASFIVIIFGRMKMWKIVMLMACVLILGPGVGTQYLYVYMSIPLVFFILSEREMSEENIFFIMCFVLVMALFPGFESAQEGLSQISISIFKSTFVIIPTLYILYEGLQSVLRQRPIHDGHEDTSEDLHKAGGLETDIIRETR